MGREAFCVLINSAHSELTQQFWGLCWVRGGVEEGEVDGEDRD